MEISSCGNKPEPTSLEKELKIDGDEYPIVWYEPEISSGEKRCLNMFSEFQEAVQSAKALGTSFLLIVPSEVDEEKVFKEFGTLGETYGRRYFDFEEEAVLKSLFNERTKPLKVYVFFASKDFENEAPVNEEEEEVMVMCDIKEMAKQFQEEFVVIWCDPELSTESKKILGKEFEIAETNIYRDFEDLLNKLENCDNSSELPYHLILSGKTQIERVIDRIDDFKGLLCLYIYDTPRVVDKSHSRKVKIEKTLEGLVPKIREGVRTNSRLKNTLPAFATQFDDWDKSHINKVHYYLRGFVNFKNRKQAQRDFLNLAKRIYQSKRLIEFEQEYDKYDKEQILKWYSMQSPVYKLINNCLRIATSDSILYCRFALKDMERAIREEHQQESKRYNGLVYRGAYTSKDEFEKLERNVGKEIEMYGFLSTTKSLKIAKKFLNDDDIEKKVLITIIIPSLPMPELDEQGFADLSKFSKFSGEEEILFNVKSRFQVLWVEAGECRQLVLLYGAKLLRQYMTMVDPRISLKFELNLEMECGHCGSKENLFAGDDEIICQECFVGKNKAVKGTFFLPVNELNEEKTINIEVKGIMLEMGLKTKEAYQKSYRCSQCSKGVFYKWIDLKNENVLIECLECLNHREGYLLLSEGVSQVFWGSKQEKWEKVDIEFKTKELKELEQSHGGVVFREVQDDNKYKRFCKMSLQKLARKTRREKDKISSFVLLGESEKNLGNYKKAQEYFQWTLEIIKFIYGESHSETATSYENLASVYLSLGEHQKALDDHLKSLEIRKSLNGEFHTVTGSSYENIAAVYSELGEFERALDYQLKGLEITKSFDGEYHPKTASIYCSLGFVYYNLGQFEKSIEYHFKSLEIRKAVFGETHFDTAISYNNLGYVYCNLADYPKALECYLKSLEIRKFIYGESHPNTATSYGNLAGVYNAWGEYQQALGHWTKSLEIVKSTFGESHHKTSDLYYSFGLLYYNLGELQKALEYFMNSLEIRKSVYGESHLNTAVSYSSAASVYDELGEYEKALEYHLKSVEITKSIYGESHPHLATSYNNLAAMYHSLGDYQKALEFHLKAFDLRKSIYGGFHPKILKSYDGLATVYYSLGEYAQALEYFEKCLEITKSVYGESHQKVVAVYKCLALVCSEWGEQQKFDEYVQKIREISSQENVKNEEDSEKEAQ